MKIAFYDVYNPLPINSGGDWYRFHLLSELGKEHEVSEYYALDIQGKEGYLPPDVNFEVRHLEPKLPLAGRSRFLSILRPEYLLSPPSNGGPPDALFFSIYYYHIVKQISNERRIPKILVMHNVEWQYLKTNRSPLYIPMKFYEDHVIRQADAVITISQSDQAYVRAIVDEEKIFYIPPKVDTGLFNPDGARYDFGSDRFNLLFYGSLDREQNHEALRFITQELAPAIREDQLHGKVRLNIFGSGIPPKHFDLENNPDINFLGQVERPADFVRAADSVIVPLKNQGGMKIRILEALACGRPVIASTQAVLGLPKDLLEYVLVADTPDEYLDTIASLVDGWRAPVIDTTSVLQSLKGRSIDNLLDYVNDRAVGAVAH